MTQLARWLTAFALTQAVEVPVYTWLLRREASALEPLGRRLAVAFGASALTHPYVWFVLPGTSQYLGYWGYVALAESFAVIAEACVFVLFGVGTRRALPIALVGNAASFAVGLLLL